jgi:hypothetical protein
MDLSINEGTLVVTGGPGDSLQSAIVIKKTPKGLSAAGAELLFLKRFGERGTDWTLKHQDLVQVDSKTYDTYEVVLADGSERSLFFDITEWLSRVNL